MANNIGAVGTQNVEFNDLPQGDNLNAGNKFKLDDGGKDLFVGNNGGNLDANVAQAKLFDGGNTRVAGLKNATTQANGKFDYNQIAGVRNNPNVTPAFIKGVEAMAQRLGAKPEHILAAMSFETGGTFSPKITNGIGATGLIQFLPSTARGLGTTTDALRNMSSTEQLKYVEKYLQPFKGKLNTLEGVYTSILSGSPKNDPKTVLFRKGTKAYEQNPLDWNKDGQITAAEATTPVAARLYGGVKNVQQKLVDLGFVPKENAKKFADGQWGSNTSNTLSNFQKSRGLPQTGNLDEATGRALFNQANQGTTQPNPPATVPVNLNPPTPNNPNNNTQTPKSDLQRGQKNAEVNDLQQVLVKLGHLTQDDMNTGPGTFGPRTERAVADFQKANNLPQTGEYDNNTRDAMNSIIGGVNRQRNNQGDVVKGLQDKLVNLGYMTRAQVNTGYGNFGPRTEAALKQFQADNKIQQTGTLGATTYKALQSAQPRNALPGGNGTTPAGNGNPAYSVAQNGRFFNVNPGILMTNSLRPKLDNLAQAYFQETGQKLQVTSGYRPPSRQADAMASLIERKGANYVRDLYANKGAVNEIISAYNRGGTAAMTRTIENQVANGTYISNHLRSNAVDVSSNTNFGALQRAANQVGGRILAEGDHYHVDVR